MRLDVHGIRMPKPYGTPRAFFSKAQCVMVVLKKEKKMVVLDVGSTKRRLFDNLHIRYCLELITFVEQTQALASQAARRHSKKVAFEMAYQL